MLCFLPAVQCIAMYTCRIIDMRDGKPHMQCNSDQASPESMIVPTLDMGQAQMEISGERFPDIVLELCDNCYWCLTCFNRRGLVQKCPVCGYAPSLLPMNIEEVCLIEHDKKRGLSICFDRKPPLR